MLKRIQLFLFIPVVVFSMQSVKTWDYFEISLSGPSQGNPFKDITLEATFTSGNINKQVTGFYDGRGKYKIRFMPEMTGEWKYNTKSNSAKLNGIDGKFTSVEADKDVHGIVRVDKTTHFSYADGTPYYPFGTTLYSWIHLPESIQKQTLETLAEAPFNKVRMCVFPQNLEWHEVPEPTLYAFEGTPNNFDFSRFNPEFFRHLESSILKLRELGIECDLIIWHPYDKGRWGFDDMTDEEDGNYLRYLIARVGAFSNIWWSLANEYDLMKNKQMDDWDRHFKILKEEDPYQHLRSIHEWKEYYDHSKSWVTHLSLQERSSQTRQWVKKYKKPVIMDECYYEGNIPYTWGDITAEDMTMQFWDTMTKGGYASHGETYLNADNIIWWSQGGKLRGGSIERIAFLRDIIESCPHNGLLSFNGNPVKWNRLNSVRLEDEYFLYYFQNRQPGVRYLELPENRQYTIEIIDTWNMSISKVNGSFSEITKIELPSKPYIALRIMANDQEH